MKATRHLCAQNWLPDGGACLNEAAAERKRCRAGDRLYGQLLEQIISGDLGEGHRLPSEMALCQTFDVSRTVVREALSRLQADGLVYAKQGVGTFVARRPPQALIQLAAPDDVSAIMACFEARVALECEAAALASVRRSKDHLGVLRNALADLKTGFSERRPGVEADLRFHRAVALASGNEYIVALLDAVNSNTAQWLHIVLNITAQHSSAERAQRVYDEHLRIFEAIGEGDPERARLLMRYHLDQARRRVTDHQRDA
jgi:DNA-binding FadR family transcriptional regulator